MHTRLLLPVALALALFAGCSVKTLDRKITTPEQVATLDHKSPFLKAHMQDGRVFVLSQWSADSGRVRGEGDELDVNRTVLTHGTLSVALDSVALFETNVAHTSGAVAALTLVTMGSLGVTAYCAANPKACFGSCPTFYVSDGREAKLVAEGFSASVLPALEATDIDALYRVPEPSDELELRMRNEALETHFVRHVEILAVPRRQDERAFATPAGTFERGRLLPPPSRCAGPEGDCGAALAAFDGLERLSLADSVDLAARETLDVEFAHVPDAPLGLVLARRQSLLSTYLFYQTLAYLGHSAGDVLALLERGGGLAATAGGVDRALGGIEVLVSDARGEWRCVGKDSECGPLATDVKLIPLPRAAAGPLHIRLRMARGLWRLDWVGLARMTGAAVPLRLKPSSVERVGGESPRAVTPGAPLTTLPGDEYVFHFRMPEGAAHELFLESRGYYLEWMRQEWLAEESPEHAAMMLMQPAVALRRLAPEFKTHEAGMEAAFWGSRYARP